MACACGRPVGPGGMRGVGQWRCGPVPCMHARIRLPTCLPGDVPRCWEGARRCAAPPHAMRVRCAACAALLLHCASPLLLCLWRACTQVQMQCTGAHALHWHAGNEPRSLVSSMAAAIPVQTDAANAAGVRPNSKLVVDSFLRVVGARWGRRSLDWYACHRKCACGQILARLFSTTTTTTIPAAATPPTQALGAAATRCEASAIMCTRTPAAVLPGMFGGACAVWAGTCWRWATAPSSSATACRPPRRCVCTLRPSAGRMEEENPGCLLAWCSQQ